MAVSGLLLATFASAALPLKLLLQGQPWRWMWLCNVASIVLLPCLVATSWQRNTAGRAVALMVCSAWLLAQWSSSDQLPPAGVSGLLLVCALALWHVRDRLRQGVTRTILVGATLSLAATILGLGMTITAALSSPFDFDTDPMWVQKIADVLALVGASVCIVTAAWWLTIRSWTSIGGAVIGVAATVLAIGALPSAARSWLAESYAADQHAAFSDWRGRIPPSAEVLWPDGLQETWFLLDRRSYLTVSQLGGIVFSADLAHEARRRAQVLAPLISPGHWFIDPASSTARFTPLSGDVLDQICAKGGPDFVVDKADLGTQVATVEWPGRARFRHLYDCTAMRGPAPHRKLRHVSQNRP